MVVAVAGAVAIAATAGAAAPAIAAGATGAVVRHLQLGS
jgi:hypothetical protein